MKKIKRRKEKAVEILGTRLLIITFMAVLVVSGIYHFDKFQISKVIVPLVDIAFISNDISHYKELEAVNRGYIDTTHFSEQITKLTQERRDNYYNSSDETISWVTRQHALIKILFWFIAVALVIIVTGFPLLVLFSFYQEAFKRFTRSWRRINEDARVKKYSENTEYLDFARSIKRIQ